MKSRLFRVWLVLSALWSSVLLMAMYGDMEHAAMIWPVLWVPPVTIFVIGRSLIWALAPQRQPRGE